MISFFKNKTQNNRIELFDIARGIGIILIIIMHTPYISDGVRGYITNFDMPLFFIVSGMLMVITHEKDRDSSVLFKKKLRTLMIPYGAFSILLLIIHGINIPLGYYTVSDFVTAAVHGITLYGDSILWFLPTLLIGEMLVVCILKRMDSTKCTVLLLVMTVFALWIETLTLYAGTLYGYSMGIVLLLDFLRVPLRGIIAGFFVSLGYIIMEKMGESLVATDTKRRVINILEGIMLLCMMVPISLKNGPADFHRLTFNNPILYFGCALMGSIGIILISSGIESFRPLSFFGRNSLIIMCTHLDFYVLYGAISIAWLIDTVVSRAKSYIFMFNIVAFTLLIEIPIIFIINRFLPFLIGKKKEG